MNVERSTVGTKNSRQPIRQKSLNLVQSRQSLTTVRQEVTTPTHFIKVTIHLNLSMSGTHVLYFHVVYLSVETLYLQRWRVNYLSASKLIGNIFCL